MRDNLMHISRNRLIVVINIPAERNRSIQQLVSDALITDSLWVMNTPRIRRFKPRFDARGDSSGADCTRKLGTYSVAHAGTFADSASGWASRRYDVKSRSAHACAACRRRRGGRHRVRDERLGERVTAVVVRSDDSVRAEDVESVCRARLADFKIPREVHFIEDLPKVATRKIDKVALRKQLA